MPDGLPTVVKEKHRVMCTYEERTTREEGWTLEVCVFDEILNESYIHTGLD